MAANSIRKQQRLIEFPLAQALDVQGHRDDHIDGFERREPVDHQAGERRCQRDFSSVFEQADSFLKGWQIGIEGPSLGVGGRLFPASVAAVIRTMGGRGR